MTKLEDKRENANHFYITYMLLHLAKSNIISFHLHTVEQKQSNIMKFCKALFLHVFCVQSFKLRFFCLFYWQAHNFQKRKLALIKTVPAVIFLGSKFLHN